MCYYTILVLCQWKKRTFSSQPNCAGRGESHKPTHHLMPTENHRHSQSGGGALRINTLDLVWVKSGTSVLARGCSQRGCSGLAKQAAAAPSLRHCLSLHTQAYSAQLPAAGKQVIPFLQARMLFPACHGCL